jgi:hypothetical protein
MEHARPREICLTFVDFGNAFGNMRHLLPCKTVFFGPFPNSVFAGGLLLPTFCPGARVLVNSVFQSCPALPVLYDVVLQMLPDLLHQEFRLHLAYTMSYIVYNRHGSCGVSGAPRGSGPRPSFADDLMLVPAWQFCWGFPVGQTACFSLLKPQYVSQGSQVPGFGFWLPVSHCSTDDRSSYLHFV